MRLHHLTISAFGPFAGTVEVDLDDLAASGLFLLSGPTGAGKSSVLDAVCFALYGDVPGDRAQARRLRCDRAAPEAVPRVEIEATLGGRRLRLRRSPAWERPKRRGAGTTRQQASVTVSERVDGEWRPLTSRLDEAGHLVTEALGMTLSQFTQVALLPQGRFQAFLRARSEERHQLLGRLFRTGRFEDVERWLRDRRTELRRRSEVHHRAVADLVSRISETTGDDVPDGWRASAGGSPGVAPAPDAGAVGEPLAPAALDLAGPAAGGEVLAWAAALAAEAADRARSTEEVVRSTAEAEATARRAAEAARTLLDQHARVARAREESARLAEAGAEHAARALELDRARRSAAVLPLHQQAAGAAEAAGRADQAAAAAVAAIAEEIGALVVERDEVARLRQRAERGAVAVRDALVRAGRLRQVVERQTSLADRCETLRLEIIQLREAQAAAPARLDELEVRCDRARAAAADAMRWSGRVDQLAARLDAAEEAVRLSAELSRARVAWLDSRQAALACQEDLLAIRTARIDGMAAEIAHDLAVGACCPVCGSDDHPRKAAPSPGSPDAAVERAAQRALDDARAHEHAHDGLVRDLVTRRALALGRAAGAGGVGGAGAPRPSGADGAESHPTDEQRAHDERDDDPGRLAHELRHQLAEARAERDALAIQGREADALAAQLDRARAEASATAARLAAATADLGSGRASAHELRAERLALEDEVRAVLAAAGPGADPAAEVRTAPRAGRPAGREAPRDEADDPLGEVARLQDALTALLDRHVATADTCREAERRLDAAATAEAHAGSCAAAVARAVAETGLGSLETVLVAARPPDHLRSLADAVATHERRLAAVESVLADPALAAARDVEAADLPDAAALEELHAHAQDASGQARERAATWAARHDRLERLVEELATALDRWGPVRTDLATASGLASFVDGRSPDNRLQMRLSAYVLAFRLAQVVAAANERLSRMTGSRYALEHTGRRGAGETRGGLSLLVRDDWSGEVRDPATLSGGETFVVSLALALGLADVIAHEAGGAQLETLFVDEGFGSLDAETLDEVMDVLDGLRDGGRVVGVVSHVAEMRARIPTRLEVVKERAGSSLRTVRG